VEQVTGPVVYHGVGPVWFPGWGGLRFVDMLAGDVMSVAARRFAGTPPTSALSPPPSARARSVAP
jgi:hypothetical protein